MILSTWDVMNFHNTEGMGKGFPCPGFRESPDWTNLHTCTRCTFMYWQHSHTEHVLTDPPRIKRKVITRAHASRARRNLL